MKKCVSNTKNYVKAGMDNRDAPKKNGWKETWLSYFLPVSEGSMLNANGHATNTQLSESHYIGENTLRWLS